MGSAAWDDLVHHLRELEVLDGARALLGWDEQTFMPRKAAEQRGEQLGLLSRLAHERITDARNRLPGGVQGPRRAHGD